MGDLAFRSDLEDDPFGLDLGLVVLVEILLGQRIDARQRLVTSDGLDDAPADLGKEIRVRCIPDRNSDSRVNFDVLVLAPVDLGIDQDVAIVAMHPHDMGLWLTVGHQSGQCGKILALGQCSNCVVDHAQKLARAPTSIGGS